MNKREFLKSACGAAMLAMTGGAMAQAKFPSKAVTLVVPYPAGGVTDLFARAIGVKLTEMWGQPVLIDNRGGGGTVIGTQMASRAAPDGHTILLTSYAYTSNPLLRKSMPYEAKSLKPLMQLGSSTSVLVIPATSKFQTLKELIAYAKTSPGRLKLASSGNGSSPHVAAELFAKAVGIEITHVAYKGTAPAMNDVLSGTVDGIFDGISSLNQVKAGRLRALAIASEERHPFAPDLPTFKELGVDLMFGSWFGFLLPAGVPAAVESQINADMRKALADPHVKAQIDKTGLRLRPGTPQQFAEFLDGETRKLKGLIDSGVKFEVE